MNGTLPLIDSVPTAQKEPIHRQGAKSPSRQGVTARIYGGL